MNQILYIQKDNKRKGGTIEVNKIIKFFTIALIVFGVILLGEGVYGAFKNNEMRQVIENAKPVCSLDREGNQLKIYATHIREISEIEYNWNNDEDTANKIEGKGRKVITQRIDLPAGENTFYIRLTDINGKTEVYSKEFYMENGKDITKPKIDVSVVGNYVKLIATDEKALSYITYRWNDEEETKLEVGQTDNTKIETSIEIKRGQNTLTIIAVDSSSNTGKFEREIKGVFKPVVADVYVLDSELYVRITHDLGIKDAVVDVNGQETELDGNSGTDLTFKIPLAAGYNRVKIIANSVEDTYETYEGECTL